jgi:hypothetical protein
VTQRSRRWTLIALIGAALTLVAFLDVPVVSVLARILLAGAVVILVLWLLWKAYRSFLYKVGRRLAFSYFLIGVLPIPLVLLLLGVIAYILSGFFLAHLYRDAVDELHRDLQAAARSQVRMLEQGGPAPSGEDRTTAFAWYRKEDGRKIAGDPRLPARWPAWASAPAPAAPAESARPNREAPQRFFAGAGGAPTLIAAASGENTGALALFTGNINREISRRGELWVEVDRPDDPGLTIQVGIGRGRALRLRHIRREQHAGEAEKFFKRISGGEKYWDDPLLWWAEVSGPLLDPATGRVISDRLNVTLNGTPRTVLRHLFSSSGEVDSGVWAALVVFAILLFDVYLIATIMAVFMIVGLSRAVNRLTRATVAGAPATSASAFR